MNKNCSFLVIYHLLIWIKNTLGTKRKVYVMIETPGWKKPKNDNEMNIVFSETSILWVRMLDLGIWISNKAD